MSTHPGPKSSGRTGDVFSSAPIPQNTLFEVSVSEAFAFDTVIEIIEKKIKYHLVWCPLKWMLKQEAACKIFTWAVILGSTVKAAE